MDVMYIEEGEAAPGLLSAFHPSAPLPLLALAEIEHRIANEFALAVSSINIVARTCNGKARMALNRAAARLCDYADAHRALLPPVDADSLDLSAHLRNISWALSRASLTERRIALSLKETQVTIETWRAWRIGLVVSELITNAARHAVWPIGGGAIRLEIWDDASDIHCRVTDNGRGHKVFSRGTGTRIVEALVGELGGCIQRNCSGDGLAVLLTIPRVHAASRTSKRRSGKTRAQAGDRS